MKKRRWYLALLVVPLTVMTVPVLSAEKQGSNQSPSELQAMPILKNMSEYLAHAERFSVVPPPRGAVIPSVPDSSTTVSGAGRSFPMVCSTRTEKSRQRSLIIP